jgi:hypothetical protein
MFRRYRLRGTCLPAALLSRSASDAHWRQRSAIRFQVILLSGSCVKRAICSQSWAWRKRIALRSTPRFSAGGAGRRPRRSDGGDPPPLKWSHLRYVFDTKEDCNGKEAIQALRDRREGVLVSQGQNVVGMTVEKVAGFLGKNSGEVCSKAEELHVPVSVSDGAKRRHDPTLSGPQVDCL